MFSYQSIGAINYYPLYASRFSRGIKLTSLYPLMALTTSTASGAIIEKIVAVVFVIAMRVPAWFGARSMWLTMKPQYWPALKATAITKIVITTPCLVVLNRPNAISAKAGTKKAEIIRFLISLMIHRLFLYRSSYIIIYENPSHKTELNSQSRFSLYVAIVSKYILCFA